jgi:hypothetical protein
VFGGCGARPLELTQLARISIVKVFMGKNRSF